MHYSMPAADFSRSDRLRFYLSYCERRRLGRGDKAVVRRIVRKANRMARHNVKHGGTVPFLTVEPSSA